MKRGLLAIIIILLIIGGFISVIYFSQSRLEVLSIFIDNVRIRNSDLVAKNGITFGGGDDDIFIKFVRPGGVVIKPDEHLLLADNVICLMNGELLNSYPLKDNNTICMTDQGHKIVLTFKDNQLWEAGKSLKKLEKKGWRRRIYPLVDMRKVEDEIYSFIYYHDKSPRILILDDKKKLIVCDNGNQEYYKKDQFHISLKEKNIIQFRKVFHRYVSYVDPETKELIAEKKVANISSIKKDFEISFNPKGFNIDFKKPVKQNIRLKDILDLKSESIVLTFGELSHMGFNVIIPKFVGKISDLSLRFDVKSKLAQNQVVVMDPHNTDPQKGTYSMPYGKLTLTDNDTEIEIWIIRLGIPWHLVIYYTGICLLFGLLYYDLFRNLLNTNPKGLTHLLLLLGACLIFLSFRLLFTYKTFIQFPFRSDLYRDAVFGFVLVPFLLLEISKTSNSGAFFKTFLRAFVLLIPCGIYLYQLSHLSAELLGFEILNEKILGLAVLMLFTHFLRKLITGFFTFFSEISLSKLTFILALGLSIGLRFFIKEAIPLVGFRASLVANLFALGLLLGAVRNYVDRNQLTLLNVSKILLFFFLYFFINAGLSGDFGYLIFFISVPLIFIYMGLLSEDEKGKTKKICISSGAVMTALLIVGIFFVGKIMLSITDLNKMGQLSNYQTRLLGFTDFPLLKAQGYQNTEVFAEFYETMKFYTASGGMGMGYLQSPLGMESNWFNDNVPSAFLMADFGLTGVLIVFIAYGFILLIVVPGCRPIFTSYNTKYRLLVWKFLGAAAACFLVFPGIYMICANIGLVPFTGKNVFLFGLDSYSDLMESAILFGLLAKVMTTTNNN